MKDNPKHAKDEKNLKNHEEKLQVNEVKTRIWRCTEWIPRMKKL